VLKKFSSLFSIPIEPPWRADGEWSYDHPATAGCVRRKPHIRSDRDMGGRRAQRPLRQAMPNVASPGSVDLCNLGCAKGIALLQRIRIISRKISETAAFQSVASELKMGSAGLSLPAPRRRAGSARRRWR